MIEAGRSGYATVMALAIIVLLTGVLTIVPILAYQRWDRRTADRPVEPVPRGPVSAPEFWRVDKHIIRGTRGPDERTRALIRAEVTWRCHTRNQPPRAHRRPPWWLWVPLAGVWTGAAFAAERITHDWAQVLLNILVGPLLVFGTRRNVRDEQQRLDAALAANSE